MAKDGKLVDALYYSTSCGLQLDQDLSLEPVFAAFLSVSMGETMKKDEPWYRWNVYFPVERLAELAAENGYGEIGTVTELIPEKRESSGCLSALTIRGSAGKCRSGRRVCHYPEIFKPVRTSGEFENGKQLRNSGCFRAPFSIWCPPYEGEKLLGYELIGGGYGRWPGLKSERRPGEWQRKERPF